MSTYRQKDEIILLEAGVERQTPHVFLVDKLQAVAVRGAVHHTARGSRGGAGPRGRQRHRRRGHHIHRPRSTTGGGGGDRGTRLPAALLSLPLHRGSDPGARALRVADEADVLVWTADVGGRCRCHRRRAQLVLRGGAAARLGRRDRARRPQPPVTGQRAVCLDSAANGEDTTGSARAKRNYR